MRSTVAWVGAGALCLVAAGLSVLLRRPANADAASPGDVSRLRG